MNKTRIFARNNMLQHVLKKRFGACFNGRMVSAVQFHSSSKLEKEKKKKEKPADKLLAPTVGASSLFDQASKEIDSKSADELGGDLSQLESLKLKKEFRFSTSNFKTSPRKLRFLADQIVGLKIQDAINQMEFSAKSAAKKILHTLAFARKNAIYQKKMNPELMVVKEAWVGKGRFIKRLDLKARGRFGVKHHPYAHMKFVLAETKNQDTETTEKDFGKRRNIKGFGEHKKFIWKPLIENKPIYNQKPYYNW
ncbi:hypothetical protein BB559_003856 [Furculomyces boomerangus]|uniref:Ribosomal protein L22 n=2 Tax=Harpellales TaxID=61421 RepID=A0A2T9YIA1_9FUNG|nr:hypothetical protein BB559_003856 [Furculomyces boomerangus]PWA00502.1 hypothetical protein BB558_003444 [Smittium angustum]